MHGKGILPFSAHIYSQRESLALGTPRQARLEDLVNLVDIEQHCFETDRLSKRSFQNFIKPGSHDLWVIEDGQIILAYILILYRLGANLARLYSIAVHPAAQGKKYSSQLLEWAEEQAHKRQCAFMRLEVSTENKKAIQLYKKFGYKVIGSIKNYYDNGEDALRMEKALYRRSQVTSFHAYYRQTTEFTCGPAALMMAMKSLQIEYQMSRSEELQIWREATTIYMTSGHGGCSPYGLALSAWRRGCKSELYINYGGAPFLDGVRNDFKKEVMQFVHEDFIHQIKDTDINVIISPLDIEQIDEILHRNKPIIALISTWRLNRNKAPHWVFVSHSDKNFVYINDSDFDEELPYINEMENIELPIHRLTFLQMAKFGQKRLRCLLVIDK